MNCCFVTRFYLKKNERKKNKTSLLMAIVSGSRLKSVDQLESVLVVNNFARASATNLGEQVMASNISAQNGIQFATLCVVCPPPKIKKKCTNASRQMNTLENIKTRSFPRVPTQSKCLARTNSKKVPKKSCTKSFLAGEKPARRKMINGLFWGVGKTGPELETISALVV